MTLEVSRDYGKTWEVVQYYDINCNAPEYAGVATTITTANPAAVICTSEFSQVVR